jgi:hypothetical protein
MENIIMFSRKTEQCFPRNLTLGKQKNVFLGKYVPFYTEKTEICFLRTSLGHKENYFLENIIMFSSKTEKCFPWNLTLGKQKKCFPWEVYSILH